MVSGPFFSGRPIDVFPVPDFDDVHDQLVLFDSIDDSVLALSNSEALASRQFLGARWSRVIFQPLDSTHDALAVSLVWDGPELFDSQSFYDQLISTHCASGP